jgi:hypothetical protein
MRRPEFIALISGAAGWEKTCFTRGGGNSQDGGVVCFMSL